MRPVRWPDAAVVALAVVAGASRAHAQPRYAAAMEEELARLGLDAQCASESADRHRCTYAARSSLTERKLTAHAVYDDRNDTVYLYIERLLVVRPEQPALATVLRRAMELNWELVLGKFEWNPKSGELRVGVVISTDSNFDRRAFRSAVKTLDTLGARYRPELLSLLPSAKER